MYGYLIEFYKPLCFLKVVKFDHFKIGIVNYFPSSKKFNGIRFLIPFFPF